jgi:lipopolysaccharide export system permease protein
MKILDKYILKQFFVTYIFVVIILLLVVSVIDYSEKSDDFLNVPVNEILFDYYVNFLLFVANLITPIIVFIATVFITSRFAARTEIIAILSGGVSFGRIMLPYLVGASVIALTTFGLNAWVIPLANKTKIKFEIAYVKNPFRFNERNIHFKLDSNVYAYMQSYNNVVQKGYKFTLEKVEKFKVTEKMSADMIEWDTLQKKWHIPTYKIHYFDGENEEIKGGAKLDTMLNLYPKDFENNFRLYETLTTQQLNAYIDEQVARGNSNIGLFVIEKYQRIASPFAIIILTILGVVVASRKSRQGTGLQIALGFVLSFAFLIIVIVGRSIGQSGIVDPNLAVWLPNLIFACITAVLYFRVPK